MALNLLSGSTVHLPVLLEEEAKYRRLGAQRTWEARGSEKAPRKASPS